MRVPLAALFLLFALLVAATAPAQPFIDEETEALLVRAVEAATKVDLFYARCRSDASYRRTENLNKLMAGKFRITVIGVQDDLFPERSYRSARERLQREFGAQLREAGGCREARKQGLAEDMLERYKSLFTEIERLP